MGEGGGKTQRREKLPQVRAQPWAHPGIWQGHSRCTNRTQPPAPGSASGPQKCQKLLKERGGGREGATNPAEGRSRSRGGDLKSGICLRQHNQHTIPILFLFHVYGGKSSAASLTNLSLILPKPPEKKMILTEIQPALQSLGVNELLMHGEHIHYNV